LRVALDYTPAISQNAGVGRYTRSLFSAMHSRQDPQVSWRLWYPSEHSDISDRSSWEGVESVALPLSSRWSNLLWHRLGVPLKIERFTGPVSVVHGTDFVVPPSTAPSVVTVHDLSYAILPQLAFPRLRRYLDRAVPKSIDRARKIIAVSETTKRDICEYYEISPNRVEVIYHASDPLFTKPKETDILAMQAQLGLRRPYFITVGTVEPRKDHQTLLRAFERVHSERGNVSLVIVGRQGWLAEEIMKSIQTAAESLPIYHLQGIRDSMLPALYGGSTALVYPSRYEGFGLPLLEAMESGTAVISSNTDALTEVGGDAALYAPVQDSEALSEHMLDLLDDSYRRESLVQAGFKRSASFSWDKAARRHMNVYREVAGVG
jgi:glycosyltransferase involved in cell wall biosynthesis